MCPYECPTRTSRSDGLFTMLFKVMCVYALLVFAGGTLVNTGNPVAGEVGQLLQLVTFVEPTIAWADSHGVEPLAHSLRFLADGFPVRLLL